MKVFTLLSNIFAFFLCLSSAFQARRSSSQESQLGRDRLLYSSRDDDVSPRSLDNEETLMNVHVTITDGEKETATAKLAKYLQSFPFAAVLPVQPLQYLPTENGVEVKFLRKKTNEKGSVDGGMVFMIKEDRDGYDIVCKRNSEGQTVSKMFSEKLVIMSLLKHITEEDGATLAGAPPANVFVESIFHKWL
ncbi:unnamed protein product [Cylindrotheca closterium]|uniref:Uncharacterized protein n=1 Tax=Cylindrotheca closterium TaxID=2856 RepID=A0AAD2FJY2_9STRA|nr:unnamed protein product [Cylindrotheca closterium]